MPTGYTAKLYDGQDQSLRDFILTCSRAMTPTIRQRDEDLSNPPRQQQRPDTSYYDEHLTTARATLAEAMAWTEQEAEEQAEQDHQRQMAAWKKSDDIRGERSSRYLRMLDEVLDWVPPTPEHQGLKDFMAEQLRSSIYFDCQRYGPPDGKSGEEYRALTITTAERNIAYYEEEIQKEIARVSGANAWIDALYASLPPEPAEDDRA